MLVAAVTGYLLGSIPIGLLVSRLSGNVDLRDYGSGKTGFTNSLRVLGLRRSVPVFAGDLLKGLLAATLPLLYTDDPWARAIGALAAIVGHIWPVFAGFRGGRGVLTGAGAVIGMSWVAAVAAVPVFLLVAVTTRYMSAASIAGVLGAAIAFTVLALTDEAPEAYAVATWLGGALIVAAHRDNIGRLLNGTERKIGQRAEGRESKA